MIVMDTFILDNNLISLVHFQYNYVDMTTEWYGYNKI